jgi:hypothetical protein
MLGYALGELATPYTLVQSFIGGLLIGLAAALLLFFSGQRLGFSGIFSSRSTNDEGMLKWTQT